MEHVQLSNGLLMPKFGLGLWKGADANDIEVAIANALDAGYRLFDSAFAYGTEEALGNAIKKWIAAGKGKREDLYITTKLPWNGMEAKLVPHFLDVSLKLLGLDYVDLYLIHFPCGVVYNGKDTDFNPTNSKGESDVDLKTDLVAIWKAMEAQVDAGKAKSIGISNFTIDQTKRILKIARIPPVNNQVEVQAYFQQKELIRFSAKHGITVTAYSPLGAPWRKHETFVAMTGEVPTSVNLLDEPIVKEIAHKHEVSAGQVLLKFVLTLGVSVVAKSSNKQRLQENFDLFSFNLDASDLQKLESLDKGEEGRANFPPFPNHRSHPECPFVSKFY